MSKIHSSRTPCSSGRFSQRLATIDSDVTCKNCLLIMNKKEVRYAKIQDTIQFRAKTMGNQVLLDVVLSLEPDDHDGCWTEEGEIERSAYVSALKHRLGDWLLA